jgi:ribonuclease HII
MPDLPTVAVAVESATGSAAVAPVRVRAGLRAIETGLHRRGFARVAGVDEAGRGACAGPLAVAAAILPEGKRGNIPGLTDSKLLTAATRDQLYGTILARAVSWHVVLIAPDVIDERGIHVCNVEGMRRAVAGLGVTPEYVLTDGFPVPGMPAPTLAVWKGDRVAACVSAASVLAKVTRDRVMNGLSAQYPGFGFDQHKGYSTQEHMAALAAHGPCPEHRFSYINVATAGKRGEPGPLPGARRRRAVGLSRSAAVGGDNQRIGVHESAVEVETVTDVEMVIEAETELIGARSMIGVSNGAETDSRADTDSRAGTDGACERMCS